jgi:hypothetical protein
MEKIHFLLIAVIILSIAAWYFSFTRFTREKYQVLFCVPTEKKNNHWSGFNITWYGFIIAMSFTFSFIVFVFLTGSSGIDYSAVALPLLIPVIIGVMASKLLAGFIEKKKATISVAAAAFIVLVLIPPSFYIQYLVTGNHIQVIPVLSAISIAYAFGEGYGRLACISFGCCYGRPVRETGSIFKKLFRTMNFRFYGKMKKAVYEGKLEGVKLVPIQGITSIIYVMTGIVGAMLYYRGYFSLTLMMVISVSSVWRFLSEFLRSDFRGQGKISAYQIMSLLNIVYVALLSVFSRATNTPSIAFENGIRAITLWEIVPILFVMFIVLTIYYGKSKVTFPEIELKLNRKVI